ncbi:hypothetical protein LOTGIDRAFT_234975 [Lottia gigantea]|uniref:START domain-containing protein n=1 Tax=Lottia gigantea TaxID=225164 RepID=V3Z9V0_LOTGI|nr:hypothetical protein LOTGIDRAFT_234975 [Lottia gigantea]ESO87743.1 hypothetical protein LOTGIDRAFT_234975 [Lottia gigantea]
MELLFLSTIVAILCSLFVFSLKYLSLLRWISGRAYVFSKNEDRLTSNEVLHLLKYSKPFPVGCQKGWKIDSFAHGHRVWFHFLTKPNNDSLINLKVHAAYSKVRASSQYVLQLLRDISLTCEWKPGVIATSYVLTHKVSPDSPSKSRSLPHVHRDIIKEERVFRRPAWFQQTSWQSLVTQTVTEEYIRYSNKEENGCCWLFQINEAAGKWTFFLAQPVEETDQCMLTVVSHCGGHDHERSRSYPAKNLLALEDFLVYRKLVATPLSSMTLPSHSQVITATELNGTLEQVDGGKRNPTKFLTRVRSFISQGSSSRPYDMQKSELKRYNSILKYRTQTSRQDEGGSDQTKEQKIIHRSKSVEGTNELGDQDSLDSNTDQPDSFDENFTTPTHQKKDQSLKRSSSYPLVRTPSDPNEAKYKTLANHAAGELLAEALKASNIELDKSAEEQAESSNGWLFTGIENDVVILRKVFKDNSTAQCYLGKGLVQAPPKTVWENLKNPRTRFTYDETLKKVDILETVSDRMKIVYQYHELQQLLRKDCCEIVLLQSERIEGEKYILSYQSVDYKLDKPTDNCTKPKLLSSGWIIEPARKEKRIYSIVTYLMQMDFGPKKANSEKYPFEEMISKQPSSIFYLQQYLHPAVLLARQKTL